MAVYTRFPTSDLKEFLRGYSLGELVEIEEIAQGVENSNYFLTTSSGKFVLTLFEKRTDPKDLPFFLSLTDHLSAKSIPCPVPIKKTDGTVLGTLAGRPAVIISFLPGQMELNPSVNHCFQLGQILAKMHKAVGDFSLDRKNNLSTDGWIDLWKACKDQSSGILSRSADWFDQSLNEIENGWPKNLPAGVVHADLFTDNVFFQDEQLSGVIDFYFACTDFYCYDLAICVNAWCFPENEFRLELSDALLGGYQGVRPLSDEEKSTWSVLVKGAATRFLLTRLFDWINTPPDALVQKKDPNDYVRRLEFHQSVSSFEDYLS